jgi:hypothetical protein
MKLGKLKGDLGRNYQIFLLLMNKIILSVAVPDYPDCRFFRSLVCGIVLFRKRLLSISFARN